MKTKEEIQNKIFDYSEELKALQYIDLKELDGFEIEDVIEQIKITKRVINTLKWIIEESD